jgi:hypothetical protein
MKSREKETRMYCPINWHEQVTFKELYSHKQIHTPKNIFHTFTQQGNLLHF